MTAILVCPLSQVTALVAARKPERIISMLDPEFAFPDAGPCYAERHLKLRFHDRHSAADGHVIPSSAHVAELLAFSADWRQDAPLLIHCRAGMGRSPAAAFIVACARNPGASEREIAVALRQVSPSVRPNEKLVALADEALGRRGRMLAAIASTGRGLPWPDVDENAPFEIASTYPPADVRCSTPPAERSPPNGK